MKHKNYLLIFTTLILSIILGINKDIQAQYKFSELIISQVDSQRIAQKLANNYFQKIPASSIDNQLTLKEAQEIQRDFVNILSLQLGKKIGYKAGLTNKKAQENFGVNHPLSGVLLDKMLLKSGAVVSSNFGARPMLEADLMVRVKSAKINEASSPEETLQYLDAVIPFLELPDLVYDSNFKPSGAELIAINVGARLGILGDSITINNSEKWQQKLANIKIILRDENNKVLAEGNSTLLLKHPLNVVFWLKNDLNKQEILLQEGDLLSLGSITPLIKVKPHTNIKVEYMGLSDKPIEIKVKFE